MTTAPTGANTGAINGRKSLRADKLEKEREAFFLENKYIIYTITYIS